MTRKEETPPRIGDLGRTPEEHLDRWDWSSTVVVILVVLLIVVLTLDFWTSWLGGH